MKRQTMLFGATLLSMLLLVSLSSAAVQVITPGNSTAHRASVTINVTYTNGTDILNPNSTADGNTTFYYNHNAITVTGFGCNDAECWATWDTTGVSDSDSKYFNVTLANSTEYLEAYTVSVTVDNTAPTCTSSQAPQGEVEYGTSVQLSCSCTDAIDSTPTYSRMLQESGQTPTTISTSPYTATGGDINTIGLATFGCGATDDAGNFGSKNLTFTIGTEVESTGGAVTTSTILSGNNSVWIVVIVVIITFIAIIGTMATLNTKRKTRKKRR